MRKFASFAVPNRFESLNWFWLLAPVLVFDALWLAAPFAGLVLVRGLPAKDKAALFNYVRVVKAAAATVAQVLLAVRLNQLQGVALVGGVSVAPWMVAAPMGVYEAANLVRNTYCSCAPP